MSLFRTMCVLALALIASNALAANLQVRSDRIFLLPIRAATSIDETIPVPTGDILAVIISDPTAALVDIEINPATGVNDLLRIVPLKKAVIGLTITVTDTSGLTSIARTIDLVDPSTIATPPKVPTKLKIIEGSVTVLSQPVPLL